VEESVSTLAGETTELRNYVLAKQKVIEAVRAARQFFQAQGSTDSGEQCQTLLVKLAEDRFNLAVVGQFKRGKSSLMNAVIGRDLLPTGLLPLTSAITTLCYGPEERVWLRRTGWVLEQEIHLDELPDYITERGNPGNEKGLVEARVELPVRFLRRGLYFIDTPGVGSARQENTATTYAFLPEVDAIIFVTSVEAPLSEIEEGFLRDIRAHVRKLFVVVNKMDLLSPKERDEILSYLHTGIARTLETPDIHLYPLSAQQGLAAKLNRDEDTLRQSGLIEFEQALTSFLAEEQGRTFLTATLDRALRLLVNDENGARPSTHNAQTPPESEITLDSLRRAMESLRTTLLADTSLAANENGDVSAWINKAVIERTVVPKTTEQPHSDGRTLLRSGTCPICAAQSQAVFDFFVHWQYALSTSEAARRTFAAERGFCSAHTWQFQQVASPQGISEGFAPLIDTIGAELRYCLEQAPEQPGERIDGLLSSVESCPACRMLQETETEQIEQFLRQIATAEGRELYARSEGLCLPHLSMTLAASSPDETRQFLLQQQVRFLEELSEDMRGYTLKRDALRRGLLNTQEKNAWRRALVQLVGERTARAGRS
jgi:GTP-binding protein EngB required for normal cell division